MAALYSVAGFISLAFNISAAVDSEKRAAYQKALTRVQQMQTGTGTDGDDIDMVYVDELQLTASLSATTIDLRSLAQAGNTMVMAKPKGLIAIPITGSGRAAFVRGATNGYTGVPSMALSVDMTRVPLCLPLYVDTGVSDKTIDYSETAAAAITVLVLIVGSSA